MGKNFRKHYGKTFGLGLVFATNSITIFEDDGSNPKQYIECKIFLGPWTFSSDLPTFSFKNINLLKLFNTNNK